MNDEREYITSTQAGKTWRLECYKPQGAPPVAVAQEGEKTPDSFSFAMGLGTGYGDRRLRLPLKGPLTAKRRAEGLALARAELKARGWID